MIKMIKWPSIEQYRNVVKNVQHKAAYMGLDNEGNPMFDKRRVSPTLNFEGTVKLHGTNASVAMTGTELWVQSRENIITPEKDNAGFAMFVKSNEESFVDLLATAWSIFGVKRGDDTIVVFGEWCGGNIQTSVALNQLPKMFVIFGIAVVDTEGQKQYLTRQQVIDTCDGGREYVSRPHQQSQELSSGIYSIFDMPVYKMLIDFENPHESQNILNELTEKVGDECPWAKQFGKSGIGEGIVWRCADTGYEDSGYWFKVKDERHSKSKVKVLATVDVERINSIKELAERLAHNGRLEQMAQTTFDLLNGGEYDQKRIGDLIKAVMSDIAKEDLDIIAASGFNMKEVSGPIAKIVRDFVLKGL